MINQRLAAPAAAMLLLAGVVAVSVWYVRGPVKTPASTAISLPSIQSAHESGSAREHAEPMGAVAAISPGVSPERPAVVQVAAAPLSNPEDRSPLADELNLPERTGIQDMEVLHGLFVAYRERFGGIPAGEDNPAIVNALTGNNPRRLAFLDRSHPAINPRGEIVDRWGTAIFFHMESRDAWEIRSAGPDREIYTSDDLRKRSAAPRQDLAGSVTIDRLP